ncbi:MAG TPA: hypothetical protein VD927_08460 [Chryseosolibacter sp.]|nr:hypothetical protein [Chryseosolibacter sp.]
MLRIKTFVVLMTLMIINISNGFAQCAMCRSTLENNYSNGNPGIASGINFGILYLLAMPYLAIMILAYLWYKHSRNGKKEFTERTA